MLVDQVNVEPQHGYQLPGTRIQLDKTWKVLRYTSRSRMYVTKLAAVAIAQSIDRPNRGPGLVELHVARFESRLWHEVGGQVLAASSLRQT